MQPPSPPSPADNHRPSPPATRVARPVLLALGVAGLVLIAGCITGTPVDEHGGSGSHGESPRVDSSDSALDTGNIPPGGERTLTFDHAGNHTVHCHPHPFMEQSVTVTEDAPTTLHVHIVDGASLDEYRFEPAAITVGVGSEVVYHNHGEFVHTATVGHED